MTCKYTTPIRAISQNLNVARGAEIKHIFCANNALALDGIERGDVVHDCN